jgi:hypothetical protein
MVGMVRTQALYMVDKSGPYLVQSLDCGVHHPYDTPTAIPSYTLPRQDKNRQWQIHQEKRKEMKA